MTGVSECSQQRGNLKDNRYKSKTDCFCQYLLFIAEEVAIPLIYSTLINLFIISGMFFSGKAYGIPLMFFVYLSITTSALFYFSHSVNCNFITGLKLATCYIRFKIKTGYIKYIFKPYI
ncbi:hypothetical protein [Photorhabdus sp. RM96S]|uniref:hypothetical protein n=1 Tax=Photorhabdus sp. RM96S TaxID=3342822 RepID=UPI0036DADDB4